TLIVFSVLAAIAYPSFQGSIRNNRLSTTNNEILGLLSLARSEGIRSNRGGGVCGSTEGTACDGSWTEGMMAWTDVDGDGEFGAGDTVLRFGQGNPQMQVGSPDPDVIAFDARGRRRAASDQAVTLTPADCKPGESTRTLTVTLSGQVRSTNGTCT
ncbi:MAG: GspH/FimT family pseudopilin, partial [Stenotrophomonas sp.]